MNNSYYFQHDYSSRSDSKIQKLIYKEGFEGYGFYWAIIEMLYINKGYLDLDCERIAFELHSDTEKIKRIIFDYDLFKTKDGLFFSYRILEQINFRKTKSEKARDSVNKRWRRQKTGDTNVLRTDIQTHSECNTIKERKGKEIKGNNNKENNIKEKSTNELFFENYFQNKKSIIEKLKEKNIEITETDLDEFFIYWSEKNQKGKQRWQMEKTFEVYLRIIKWISNKKKWEKPQKKEIQWTDISNL